MTAAYGYNVDSSAKDNARQKQATDYAKAIGCSTGFYWLRSPDYYYNNNARYVYGNGAIYNYYYVHYEGIGVVPSLSVKID